MIEKAKINHCKPLINKRKLEVHSNPHLANVFEQVADTVPENTAIVYGRKELSWREFDDRSARLATALVKAGVKTGDVVAIAMFNCPEWLEAFYGILKIRAIPANINYRYQSNEMLHLLQDCAATAVIFHTSLAQTILPLRASASQVKTWIAVEDEERLAAGDIDEYEHLLATCPPAIRCNRPAEEHYLSYTGGTTGLPKGVLFKLGLTTLISHRFVNAIFGYEYTASSDLLEMTRAMDSSMQRIVAMVPVPLMHSTGLAISSIPTLAVGGTVVLMTSKSFDPDAVLAECKRTNANRITIVGDAFARPLLQSLRDNDQVGIQFSCNHLKVIASSGASLSATTKKELLEYFPGAVIIESLGATEGVSFGVAQSNAGDSLETGRFRTAPGVLVVDEHFNPLSEQIGQVGLLAAPVITSGYFNNPKKTAEIYRDINGVLYAAPGDYGRLEADGTLTLLGRGAGVINTGGEKVFAEEVENTIKQMDSIVDCIVVGLPDERFGQTVAAVVQLKKDCVVPQSDIIAWAKSTLAGYKAPRRMVYCKSLPRFPNGKPDYDKVRKLLGVDLGNSGNQFS